MDLHRITSNIVVALIATVVLWSIANVSSYAMLYHPSRLTWSLGIAVGAANALSVFAFAVAPSREVRIPAAIGIALFGGTSGVLQTLLYLHEGAPMLAALAFGWFGPIAEAVLAWLEAALRMEEQAARAARKERRRQDTTTVAMEAALLGANGENQKVQLRAATPGAMTTEQRRKEVMKWMRAGKPCSATELARRLGVNPSTITRDVRALNGVVRA